jgi:uncharacterized membrane protein
MKTITHKVHINAPVERAYQAYRNYYGLSSKMTDVETVQVDTDAVTQTEAKVLHWKVKSKAGIPLEWEANVVSELENKEIRWAENEHSTIKTHGSVQFYKVDSNTCEVVVECHYNVAGNDALASIGEIFANPQELLEDNLHDYKLHVESLSIAAAPTIIAEQVQPTDTNDVSVPYLHV